MAGTFLGMLVLAGAPWAAFSLGGVLFGAWQRGAFLWPSPVNTFVHALAAHYRPGRGPWMFWGSLMTLLGLASAC